jgi:hypothetical protein
VSFAEVDLVRIDGTFPSFSDDDQYIVYNEDFAGVAAVRRDGSRRQQIYKVRVGHLRRLRHSCWDGSHKLHVGWCVLPAGL